MTTTRKTTKAAIGYCSIHGKIPGSKPGERCEAEDERLYSGLCPELLKRSRVRRTGRAKA